MTYYSSSFLAKNKEKGFKRNSSQKLLGEIISRGVIQRACGFFIETKSDLHEAGRKLKMAKSKIRILKNSGIPFIKNH